MLPWWTKIGAKMVLARLPFGYGVWQRLGLFRHGQMDNSGYAIRIFDEHVSKAGLQGQLAGKTLLEIGPGDSISSAIIAAAYGARAVLVDSGPYVRADVAPYRNLERTLRERGLQPPRLDDCASVEAILERCKARYFMQGLVNLRTLDTASIDLIFSQAVLEHVRKHEFLSTMQECRRILAPGGICSHQVDLRDHLGGALNNLRFSERTWESNFFVASGFYTNRISFSTMTQLFRDAGFDVQVGAVRRWSKLPTPRARLAPEFRRVDDQELCVSGFEVLLR